MDGLIVSEVPKQPDYRSFTDALEYPFDKAANQCVDPRNCGNPTKSGSESYDTKERVAAISKKTRAAIVHEGSTAVATAHVVHGLTLGTEMTWSDHNWLLEVLAKTRVGNRTTCRVHNGQPDETHSSGRRIRSICGYIKIFTSSDRLCSNCSPRGARSTTSVS